MLQGLVTRGGRSIRRPPVTREPAHGVYGTRQRLNVGSRSDTGSRAVFLTLWDESIGGTVQQSGPSDVGHRIRHVVTGRLEFDCWRFGIDDGVLRGDAVKAWLTSFGFATVLASETSFSRSHWDRVSVY